MHQLFRLVPREERTSKHTVNLSRNLPTEKQNKEEEEEGQEKEEEGEEKVQELPDYRGETKIPKE